MAKQIYIGGTPLIDLTGYATESYVDTAVSNVDVTDQLSNYVLKTALDASYGAVDASIKNSDASISSIKTILGQITGDGAEVTAAIDTFNELKQFVADYTTANDLSTLIASVKTQAVDEASADAATKYQPIGSYLVADDISTFITENDASVYLVADDISTFVTTNYINHNFGITHDAGDSLYQIQINGQYVTVYDNSYIAETFATKSDTVSKNDASVYLVADDISTFVTATDAAATYMTKNDASTHVSGNGVLNIVKLTSQEYAALESKSATTLYIVSD